MPEVETPVVGTTGAGVLGQSLGIIPTLAVRAAGDVVAGAVVLVPRVASCRKALASTGPAGV